MLTLADFLIKQSTAGRFEKLQHSSLYNGKCMGGVESVLGCGGSEGVRKCRGRCGENCGRVYEVNVEAAGKCVGMWG